ncbi:hypothetical protein AS594_33340 [Streptomyces agglomeratus]|uniref:Uncharacterized protein n=1 Tax=Streptomyces agglomeratus TaxID=285458 RepID=A0A1E5PGG5_9ACTN|nr:hypothetical protein AS594_33340 [Streptomyces agglomeratus]
MVADSGSMRLRAMRSYRAIAASATGSWQSPSTRPMLSPPVISLVIMSGVKAEKMRKRTKYASAVNVETRRSLRYPERSASRSM